MREVVGSIPTATTIVFLSLRAISLYGSVDQNALFSRFRYGIAPDLPPPHHGRQLRQSSRAAVVSQRVPAFLCSS